VSTPYRYLLNVCQDMQRGGGYYYIYDRKLMGECGLPISEHNLSATKPLRWHYSGSVHGPEAFMCADRARRFLELCTARWGRNPNVDAPHPQDVDWERVADDLSRAARAQEGREAAVHEHLS
jgi:hypothetical protein